MTNVYKWGIGALTTLVMFFGGLYVTGTADAQKVQSQQLLNHEQRITTLEESKRYTEQLLAEIRESIQRVESAVTSK